MNIQSQPRFDKSTFFSWVAHQERRFELVGGKAMMQPYVSINHMRVCTSTLITLQSALDPMKFDVMLGDFAVETGANSVRFADVMVAPRLSNPEERVTADALLLVEVLSPSTAATDFGDKVREYLALPTLGTYLICAQDARRVWVWTRGETGWPEQPDVIEDPAASIRIPALDLSLTLEAIYRYVDL